MLEIMARERPDLVLMDVMMPGVDGREAYRQLRSRPEHRDVPVVMMSAAVQPHGLDPSIAGFMAKPFDLTQLVDLVASLIGRPHQRLRLVHAVTLAHTLPARVAPRPHPARLPSPATSSRSDCSRFPSAISSCSRPSTVTPSDRPSGSAARPSAPDRSARWRRRCDAAFPVGVPGHSFRGPPLASDLREHMRARAYAALPFCISSSRLAMASIFASIRSSPSLLSADPSKMRKAVSTTKAASCSSSLMMFSNERANQVQT